jgi:uncharacterized protein YxeA
MKTFSVYELSNGQPSRFYNNSTNSFTSDVKKATLYTKEEAESKRKELEKSRTDQYQKTGKKYTELHTGDLFKKGILKETIKSLVKQIVSESKFPDLTGDGKVTRADILKGRGVKFKDDIKENLINNPNAVLKGKTIQSFKSNGYGKGYTITFEDGTTVNIRGGGPGAVNTVYITKG